MAVPGIVWLEVMDFCCVCICENTLNQINMAVVRSDWSVNRFVLWHGLHMVWEAQSSCVINASKLPPEPLLDPPYPPTPLTLALHPFNPSPPPFFLMQYSWQGWPKWQRINIYIFSSGRLAGTSTWKKKIKSDWSFDFDFQGQGWGFEILTSRQMMSKRKTVAVLECEQVPGLMSAYSVASFLNYRYRVGSLATAGEAQLFLMIGRTKKSS